MKANALARGLTVAGVAGAATGHVAFDRPGAALADEWIAQTTERGRIVDETMRLPFTRAENNAGR